jgi:hypothetical protein
MRFAIVIIMLSVTITLAACGDKSRSKATSSPAQSFSASSLPLDSNRLETGQNQIFKLQVTAHEDIYVDRMAVKIYAAGEPDITRIEARDDTAATIMNSTTTFPQPPTFPIEMSIILDTYLPQGTTKTFFIFTNISRVDTGDSLQVDLVNLIGRISNRGLDLERLPNAIRGPTLVN